MKRNVVCYEEETPALAIYEFLARVVIRGVVDCQAWLPDGIDHPRLPAAVLHEPAGGPQDRRRVSRGRCGGEPARRANGACRCVDDRIAKTVRSLAAEARDMELRLAASEGDLVPCVVGGASRVQELVIDLLAISRYAQNWTDQPPSRGPPRRASLWRHAVCDECRRRRRAAVAATVSIVN